MQPKIKDGNSVSSLLWLLRNKQIAQWETLYRAEPYESRSAVEPSGLAQVSTHRLVFQNLDYAGKQTKEFGGVLTRSRFGPPKPFIGVRLGMRFYDYSGKVIFDFFTHAPFTEGLVNGQYASFEGDLPAYLKGFVARYFEG